MIRKSLTFWHFKLLLGCILSASITACTSTGGLNSNTTQAIPLSSEEDFSVDLNTIYTETAVDVFKPGDTAIIDVYNVDSLSNEYLVDRLGNINMPLIGPVKVSNLNTLVVQEELVRRYGDSFLENPSIHVKIDQRDLGKIVVDGAVNEAGVFDLANVITLSQAIALAGGVNSDASIRNVFIVRVVNGEKRVREANLKDIRAGLVSDPQIIPNDAIFVNESPTRVAFREFLRTVPLLNTVLIFRTR